jgi:hypothetical protein
MDIKLWSDEFFIDKLERTIKNEIGMYFHVHHDRHPTKEEIESFFDKWKSRLECNITSYDLGIFE